MTRIEYIGLPSDIKREVQAVIRDYRHLLPGWVERIVFQYAHDAAGNSLLSEGAIALIEAKHEYRYAVITIFGSRWSDILTDREGTIVHELAHLPVEPIAAFAFSLLERRAEASADAYDPLVETLREQHRVSMESTVQDVARSWIKAVRGR